MMKPGKHLVWMGVVVSVSSGLVFACPPERACGDVSAEKQVRLMEKFGDQGIDANNDGELTRSEIRRYKRHMHNNGDMKEFADGNRDFRKGMKGKHHRNHGPQMRGKRRGGTLQALKHFSASTPPDRFSIDKHPEADLDGNGELSSEEWRAFADERIQNMLPRLQKRSPDIDANADGDVSAEELAAFLAASDAKHRAHILIDHPDLDVDGDELLSDEELEAHKMARRAQRLSRMLERHPEADTNSDGELSAEEAEAFRTNMPCDRQHRKRGIGFRR